MEWQFYLAWPLVVAVAARGRHAERVVAWLAGTGALLCLALMHSLGAAVDTTRAYEGTDTRAAALLLGAFVATAPVRDLARRVPRRAADLVCLVLACALASAWAVTDGEKAPLLFQGGLFLHSLAAAVLIVLMSHVPGTRAARAAGGRLPRRLGEVSDALPHIFDRFHKADAARTRSEGSGLGLAIARENVRLHHGTLFAANLPEGGAVFTLTLPDRRAQEDPP